MCVLVFLVGQIEWRRKFWKGPCISKTDDQTTSFSSKTDNRSNRKLRKGSSEFLIWSISKLWEVAAHFGFFSKLSEFDGEHPCRQIGPLRGPCAARDRQKRKMLVNTLKYLQMGPFFFQNYWQLKPRPLGGFSSRSARFAGLATREIAKHTIYY